MSGERDIFPSVITKEFLLDDSQRFPRKFHEETFYTCMYTFLLWQLACNVRTYCPIELLKKSGSVRCVVKRYRDTSVVSTLRVSHGAAAFSFHRLSFLCLLSRGRRCNSKHTTLYNLLDSIRLFHYATRVAIIYATSVPRERHGEPTGGKEVELSPHERENAGEKKKEIRRRAITLYAKPRRCPCNALQSRQKKKKKKRSLHRVN